METIDPTRSALEVDRRHRRVSNPWELFHEASRLRPPEPRDRVSAEDAVAVGAAREQEERLHRLSMHAPRASSFFHAAERVFLPLAEPERNGCGLSELSRRRRSVGGFDKVAISVADLSHILACGAGVSHIHPVGGMPLRMAPSSGALYELELYLVVRSVTGLAPGLYHYHPSSHTLAQLGGRERIAAFARAAVSPALVESAPVYAVWTSVIGRLDWKYDQRAYRFTHLNAGHVAQQMCLAATERGYASCPHGGFFDDEIASALDIDGNTEFAVHTLALGRPRTPSRPPRVAARATSGARLRRFEALGPDRASLDWRILERLLDQWSAALEEENAITGREALIELRAHLPGDRTLRNLEAWFRDSATRVSLYDELILRTPVEWAAGRRTRWRNCAEKATAVVKAWLGVEALPRVVLDLSESSPVPRTENRERWLHRRVLLPSEHIEAEQPDLDIVIHEVAHAAYLPHNAVLGEGIAAAIASVAAGDGGYAETVEELRNEGIRPDLEAWIRKGSWPRDEPHLAAGCAGSFVTFLFERFGPGRFFGWTNSFLYPATESERDAVGVRFEEGFEMSLARAIDDWWTSCR